MKEALVSSLVRLAQPLGCRASVLELPVPVGERDQFGSDAGQFVTVATLGLLDGLLEVLDA